MSLTPEAVHHIARLARIAMNADEEKATRDKLDGIFALIEAMQAVDTTGVEPMSHPQDIAQRLLPDEVTESDRRDAFQNIAPQTAGGLYLVPRVIE